MLPKRLCRHGLAFVLLLITSSPLYAHDLWLDLQKDPASGKAIVVRAVLGAKFPKTDEVKKVEDYREARVIAGAPAGPLADFGAEPTLVGRVTTQHPFAVSVLGPTREIDLKIDEARGYLEEEVGLSPERIAAILEGGPTVHEVYTRILKAIDLRSGDLPSPPRLEFGLPLEISLVKVDSSSPERWNLAFRILKDGKPLPNVQARVMGPSGKTQFVRTNPDGHATVSMPHGSPLLIAYIEVTSAGKGRYQTLWTNLAIFLR